MEWIFIIAILLIIALTLYSVKYQLKRYSDNIFFKKDNADIKVVFRYFITALDKDFNTVQNIVFYREDNHTIYTMPFEDFKKKFIRYKDYKTYKQNKK